MTAHDLDAHSATGRQKHFDPPPLSRRTHPDRRVATPADGAQAEEGQRGVLVLAPALAVLETADSRVIDDDRLAVLEDSQAARRGAAVDADRSRLIGRVAWLGSPSSERSGRAHPYRDFSFRSSSRAATATGPRAEAW
jgi:hypothetical protein